MQTIEFKTLSIAKPFSEKYVDDVEAAIGIKFPQKYLDLMRQKNGGDPVQQCFTVGMNEKVIERFLSFVENYKVDQCGIYDIEVVWGQIEDRLEEGICPFAALYGGDFLCFDGRFQDEAAIVIWDHEQASQGKSSITPVADSFEVFSEMLKEL